jgi:SagB-type dehydrogenase family enzyme
MLKGGDYMPDDILGQIVDNIGSIFQKYTKYGTGRNRMSGGGQRWHKKAPGRYKSYPEAALVELPETKRSGGPALWSVLEGRRSRRDFSGESISKEELSLLLWAIQGESGGLPDWPFRTAPSAGALYPVETYPVILAVEGLSAGIYHYQVRGHGLERLREGDFSRELAAAALGQGFLAAAACVFVWTALIGRSAVKYGQRAYRYIYLDAGHIGQNLHLAAEGLGLGCCMIGALYDDEVNGIVGADGEEETVLYLGAVGRSQGR